MSLAPSAVSASALATSRTSPLVGASTTAAGFIEGAGCADVDRAIVVVLAGAVPGTAAMATPVPASTVNASAAIAVAALVLREIWSIFVTFRCRPAASRRVLLSDLRGAGLCRG